MSLRHPILIALTLLFLAVLSFGQSAPSSLDRDRGRTMLNVIKNDLKKNYYDTSFHGMDVDARFKQAEEKINSATSQGQILGIIAQVLLDLDDSHTYFIPPSRPFTVEYGWHMQIIGEKCYIVAVKPGSDADLKGIKEGDEIYSIDGFAPTREQLWKILYTYQALR